jgi:hypothetical protein
MANHQIPRKAHRVEQHHGIDANGNVVTLSVYRHVRQGHTMPMFFVVQYREAGRRIDLSTRVTREFSGPQAEQKMREAVAPAAEMLAASREAASRRLTSVK